MMKKIFSLCLLVLVGSTVFAQSTFRSSLPVKARKGATVSGVVEVAGKPLAGVVVSDGYEVTVTDKKGCYYLASEKKNGNVFISIPAGYEVPTEGAMPQYWATLTQPAGIAERHDFTLTPVNNDKHVIVALTDIHLSNQVDDIRQFRENAMPAIRAEIEKYRSQGIPVYTMCMGDSSFDLFWYDYLFDINDFRNILGAVDYPTPVFHTMGNHDNDGATPHDADTDFNATKAYRKAFGPTYYSFNIGGVHYVMLDNIVYKNEPEGGLFKPGKNIVGRRNYDHYINDEQLEWLRKDLSYVTDKSTPIVLGMHCPVYVYKAHKAPAKDLDNPEIITRFVTPEKAAAFSEILKDYEQVHILSGHTHKNLTCYGRDDKSQPLIANTIEHNFGAVGGSWWFTGAHGGLTLGPDTAPAGFEVFPVDGKHIEWYYTSVDDGPDKQFRTFDINCVRDYYNRNSEMAVLLDHFPKRYDFRKAPENEVYIHVWAWEPTWKLVVKDNGKELKTERRAAENPQYTVSYDIPKTLWARQFPKKYGKARFTPHIFVVKASAPDTTLEIEVTDSFGRVYRETMVRPKEFSKLMR